MGCLTILASEVEAYIKPWNEAMGCLLIMASKVEHHGVMGPYQFSKQCDRSFETF